MRYKVIVEGSCRRSLMRERGVAANESRDEAYCCISPILFWTFVITEEAEAYHRCQSTSSLFGVPLTRDRGWTIDLDST